MTITVQNSATPLIERKAMARRLGIAAARALPDSTRVRNVTVQFTRVERRAGVTITRPQQVFSWPASELRDLARGGRRLP